jgi:hypothetical protein
MNLNQILSAFEDAAGISRSDLDRFVVTGLSLGSLLLTALVVNDPSQDYTTFTNNF